MRCAGCGQELLPNQMVCPNCGLAVVLEDDDSAASLPIHAILTIIRFDGNLSAQSRVVGIHDLTGQEVVVGRLPSSDITLEGDSLVSRRHVRFFARRGQYFVEDLESSNQT